MATTRQSITLADLPAPPAGRTGWPWTEAGVPALDPSLPRITVVTPSYNQVQYLEETLRSILLQGYPDLELLVVDGGSTDGSVEIIRKYERHIAWWTSERDRGQSHAINKGFTRATGAIVGWLNSDDVFFPGALPAIGAACRAHPGAGMIYGAGAKIDTAGRVLKEIPFRPVDLQLLRTQFYILQASCFIARSALDEVGLLDEGQHYVMDWDLALRVTRKFPLVAIPDRIGMWRDYPETKTRTISDARFFELVRTARKFNGLLDRNVLSFAALYPIVRARRATGSKLLALVERLFRGGLRCVWSESTYMAHSLR